MHILLFLGSLIVLAGFIGSSVFVDWLLGFAVDQETVIYQ